MAKSPTIVTPRLRVEPFSANHLSQRYVGWLNDPRVVRYSDQRFRTHTFESCREYWLSYDGTPHHFWAILVKDGALGHIGNINAYVDPPNGIADLGILVGEQGALHKGYALEAWLAVCEYLFDSGLVRKVTAGCLAGNQPMTALMRRAGMVPDGVRIGQAMFEGQPMDIIHAALFIDQWRRPSDQTAGG